ncbi:MAG: multidrug transporter [Erysipelotrichaceae bacterium]|nr:multidrug transporter [Erysipelotrichaceae bacterium]
MKTKYYLLAASIWLVLLGCVVSSKADSLTYTIYFDTETTNSAEIKQGILDNYRTLIRGVHEESEAVLVAHNLSCFMWETDMIAEWNSGELVVTIGDGKGAVIRGDLEANETCLPEVKPKSWLMELFSFD